MDGDEGQPTAAGGAFAWACALGAGSGAAALGHQLLWTRRTVDLLGAGTESAARVFACFFLGLALGSGLGAWLARRVRRPWLTLGLAEAGVAALCLPVVFLPFWTSGLWTALGPEALESGRVAWVKLGLSLLTLTPPAVLMGVFLPLAGRAVFGERRRLGRDGLWLYALNTLGGVAGMAAVLLWAQPALGAMGAMWAILAINAAVAGGCFAAHARFGAGPGAEVPTPVPERRLISAWVALLAFASGFLVLASELAFLQMLLLAAPLSLYAAAGMLMTVILCLGLSALATPRLLRAAGGPAPLLPFALGASALATLLAPAVFHVLARFGLNLFEAGGVPAFFAALAGVSLLVLGPVFLFSGVVLPAVFAAHGEGAADERGHGWGWILAANGLGGFLGAEFAYRFLMPAAGIYGTVAACAAVYAVLALAAAARVRSRAGAGFALASAAAALLAFAPVSGLPSVNPSMPVRVLHAEAGREGSLAVIESPAMGRAMLLQNQYMLGSTAARYEQERLGHLPLLLHPAPRRVGYIGMATGITPSAALRHEGVERIEVAELSRSVARAAEDWFAEFNGGLHADPRVRLWLEDGRVFAAAHSGTFDVLTGDLFLPWGPGEGRLYAVEHFAHCRAALRPGGVFVQWLPMHQLTRGHFAAIRAAFAEVFGEHDVFTAGFEPHTPLLALVGWNGGGLDWEVVRARTAGARASLADPVLRHAEGLALLYLGRPETKPDVVPNTLNNMRLELEAARRRVGGGAPYLAGTEWLELRGELAASAAQPRDGGGLPNAAERIARASLRVRTGTGGGRSMREWLPEALLLDSGADWRRWPGPDPRYH
ncbi:MAG: fused MFS/spermidine synthase [Opitutales bacterium]|nr:fused MFS/spermidine synthase [Opitutales bacterium]